MRATESDESELRELMARGYRYALALHHDEAKASDLLQEACLAVIQAEGPWARGYLFSAIRTRFLNEVRRARLVAIEPVADIEAVAGDNLGPALGDGEAFPADDESLHRALGRLGPDHREALYLAAVEGLSTHEIAELMGRPRNTVLSLIHRARHRVRGNLETAA